MRSFGKCALVIASIFGTATSTLAHDQTRWSGFYVGGQVGGAWADIDARDVLPPIGGFFTPTGNSFSFSTSGFGGGVQAGLQHQWSQLVLGAEVSWVSADMEKRIISPYFPSSDTETAKVEGLAVVVGRIGMAFDKAHAYVKAGYAGGDVSFRARDDVADVTYGQKSWHHGYALGAGVEYALSSNLRIGLDYTFADLGSVTKQGLASDGGDERYRLDAEVQTVMLRLNYFIGRGRDHHEPMK